MTISSEVRKAGPYDGNDVTTSFPFSFKVFSADDVVVVLTDPAGIETTLTGSGTDYSVTLNADQDTAPGGTVEKVSALATDYLLTITSSVPNLQPLDLTNQGGFYPKVINAALDRLTILAQQNAEAVSRSLKTAISTPAGVDSQLPAPVPYALIGWNADGTGFQNADPSYANALSIDLASTAAGKGGALVGFKQSESGAVARTVHDKLREFVSVKDFGAVGDGTTDDTAAFAAALAASAYEVYVPHGTYIISGLTVDGKRLQGPGTIKWKAGASSACIVLTGSKPSLRNLLFDGNASAQTDNLIMIQAVSATDAEIYGCCATNGKYKFFRTDVGSSPGARVEANLFHDWGTYPGCNVVDFRSSYGLVVGNRFSGIGDGHCVRIGVYETDPTTPVVGCVVSGNTFTDTEHVGVCLELYAQGVVISGNSFVGLQQGVKIESAGYTAFDIVITGNYFANLTGTTAFNLTGAQVTFTGNVCVDCAGGVDLGPRSVCNNNIIRNCGELASSMPSIRVVSGVDCTVIGNYVESAPFRAIKLGPRSMCAYNRVINSNSYGVHISSADVTAVGNTVTGGTHGIVLSSTGTNAVITGNRVSGASTTNYSIDGTARATAILDITNIGYSPSVTTLTLASDAITVPRENTVVVVDTEARAATDTLSTINTTGGGYLGQIIVLRGNSVARVVTVSDSSNIRTAGSFVLNSTEDTLTLMWNGTYWLEVSRSDNA